VIIAYFGLIKGYSTINNRQSGHKVWLADTSVKRPVFATMLVLVLVVLGVVSYPNIGVDLFPKIDLPIVHIRTTLKGASSEIMDIDVTDKIEEAVNTINGIKTIARFNGINSVNLGIQKQSGTNTVEVVNRVKQELKTIRKTLPAGMNLAVAFDQSDFIKRSINDVQHHLIYGGRAGLSSDCRPLLIIRSRKSTVCAGVLRK